MEKQRFPIHPPPLSGKQNSVILKVKIFHLDLR